MTGLIVCIVCVFLLHTLIFPKIGLTSQALSCKCKTKKANFTGWMSFLQRNVMKEINLNPAILGANT